MVRNWQSRVEIATARRNISKQKKSKMDQKRQWKSSIQEFQSMIDRISTDPKLIPRTTANATTTGTTKNEEEEEANQKLLPMWKLHIWTDTAPLSSVQSASFMGPSIDEDGDDDAFVSTGKEDSPFTRDSTSSQRRSTTIGNSMNSNMMMDDLRNRMRSKSLGEQNDKVYQEDDDDDGCDGDKKMRAVTNTPVATKGRPRSNSTTVTSTTSSSHWSAGKKKKYHPRSHMHSSSINDRTDKASTMSGSDHGPLTPVYTCRSLFYTGACEYYYHPTTPTASTAAMVMASPRGTAGRKGTSNVTTMMNNIIVQASSSCGGCRHLHGCCSVNGTIHQDTCMHNIINSSRIMNDVKHSKSVTGHVRKELQRSNDAEQEYYNQFGSASSFSNSETFQVRDVGAMDMLYHIEIDVALPTSQDNETPQSKLPSEVISEMITKLQLYLASITYIVIDTVLVYDRYRNGLLFNTEQELIMALVHSNNVTEDISDDRRRRRGNSIVNNDDTPQTTLTIDPMSWNHIPDTILVHVLSFLPDFTVAPMSRVCKQWYHEIQTNSILWRNMLDNRNWPHPCTTESANPLSRTSSRNISYREMFCQHYTVLRDMKALRYGLDVLLDTRNGITSSKEMAYRKFANTTKKHHSPTQPTTSIGVRNWSPNRTLVAYDRDCTVRLFETQPGGENGSTVCKEIICQKFDPYRMTKKRNCILQSFDLDDQCITCVGRVTGGDTHAYILLVMSREDFLLGDTNATSAGSCGYSEDISKITVIDIGEAIFHYLVSLDDDIDGSLMDVADFLNMGNSIGGLTILPTSTIAACGNGRFMIDLELFVPEELDEFDWDDVVIGEHGRLIDKRLYLFSSTVGAIVWSYEIDPYVPPRSGERLVSSFRRQMADGYARPICYFAMYETLDYYTYHRERIVNQILIGDIEPSGSVDSILHLTFEHCDMSIYPGWRVDSSLMVPSATDLIIANAMSLRQDQRSTQRKIVVSFCDLSQFTDKFAVMHKQSRGTDLEIAGDLNLLRMCLLRDDYIAIVGYTFDNDPSSSVVTCIVVVIHVPTRKEMFRTQLCNHEHVIFSCRVADQYGPLLTQDCQETVGMSMSWEGVVMAGRDVREVMASSGNATSLLKQKKKPHLRNNQGYKKDGFRLGKK